MAVLPDFTDRLQHGLRFAIGLCAQRPARRQDQGLLAFLARPLRPHCHRMRSRIAARHLMGDRFENAEGLLVVAGIKRGCEAFHDVGARADIFRQLGSRNSILLEIRERFARLDRAILTDVPDQRQLRNARRMRHAHEIGRLPRTERRGFIDDDDGVGQLLDRPFLQARRAIVDQQCLMAIQKGRDGFRGYAEVIAQLAGDFSTDRQRHNIAPLRRGDAGDGLKHGGLASPGHALDRDDPVLRRQDQRCGGLLLRRQSAKA